MQKSIVVKRDYWAYNGLFLETILSTVKQLVWSDPKIPRARQPRNYVL